MPNEYWGVVVAIDEHGEECYIAVEISPHNGCVVVHGDEKERYFGFSRKEAIQRYLEKYNLKEVD